MSLTRGGVGWGSLLVLGRVNHLTSIFIFILELSFWSWGPSLCSNRELIQDIRKILIKYVFVSVTCISLQNNYFMRILYTFHGSQRNLFFFSFSISCISVASKTSETK